MEKILVETKAKKYPIYFENDFNGLKAAVVNAGLEGTKIHIVSDSNVGKIYSQKVKEALKEVCAQVSCYEFTAGEKSKNLDTIMDIYDSCIENGLDRKSVIACLGGGVVGDMAGFAAASFMRGIKFVQIPTSLLAQVDSSVGGKVGVDYKGNKNMVGAFYQPEFVYMNMEVIETLPEREFSAGMAEVIKYGPIGSKAFIDYINENKAAVLRKDKAIMAEIIKQCCQLKAEVVSKDENDMGDREILNFGHTIGHAVETKKDFALLHGECVGIGMNAVLHICENRGYISKETADYVRELLSYFNIPLTADELSVDEVYEQMFKDKKVKNNVIRFVLMKDFGKTERTGDVTKDEIMSALNYILG